MFKFSSGLHGQRKCCPKLKIPYSHCGKLLCLGTSDKVLNYIIFSTVWDMIRLIYNYLQDNIKLTKHFYPVAYLYYIYCRYWRSTYKWMLLKIQGLKFLFVSWERDYSKKMQYRSACIRYTIYMRRRKKPSKRWRYAHAEPSYTHLSLILYCTRKTCTKK